MGGIMLYVRKKPIVLEKLEAIVPRLAPQHPSYSKVEHALAKEWKGFIGEKKVDFFLQQLDDRFTILSGIYLRVHDSNFQIDTLVISPQALYIIEVKNYNGTITFDTTLQQFFRNDGLQETGYRYPITQAELQKSHLENWLLERSHAEIPIYYFIAIAEPSTIIQVKGDEQAIARVVSHGEHIASKIWEIEQSIQGTNTIEQQKIEQLIRSANRSQTHNVLDKYMIKKTDILPGVVCSICGKIGMERIHGAWKCPHCQGISSTNHLKAINDYLLLINHEISNQECMRFLGIKSHSVVTRLLKGSNLSYNHTNRKWIKKS